MSALAETFEPLNASKLLASNCGAEFSPANGIMSDGTTSDGRFVTRPFVGRVDAYWSFYGATSTGVKRCIHCYQSLVTCLTTRGIPTLRWTRKMGP